jgi:hypothetical protein
MTTNRKLTGINLSPLTLGIGFTWENIEKSLPAPLSERAKGLVEEMLRAVSPDDELAKLAVMPGTIPGLTFFCGLFDEVGRENGCYFPVYDSNENEINPLPRHEFVEVRNAINELVAANLLVLDEEIPVRKVYRLKIKGPLAGV